MATRDSPRPTKPSICRAVMMVAAAAVGRLAECGRTHGAERRQASHGADLPGGVLGSAERAHRRPRGIDPGGARPAGGSGRPEVCDEVAPRGAGTAARRDGLRA